MEASRLLVGMLSGAASLENNLTVPKRSKTQLSFDPAFSLHVLPQRNENTCSHKILYMNVHNWVIHNSQKVERTPKSINWWANKMRYVSAMVYYLAIKRSDPLIHATT